MNAHLLKKWFYFRERLPAHRWSLGASNGLLVQSMLRCRTPAGGRWDTGSGLHCLLIDFAGTVCPKGSSFWQRLDVCYSGQMTWVQARFPRKERARCCPWDFLLFLFFELCLPEEAVEAETPWRGSRRPAYAQVCFPSIPLSSARVSQV